MQTLNEVYSSLAARRRYEVWFIRMGLADGSGAWWFRYLLTNPGRGGCSTEPWGMPVQVWASWFPAGGSPQTFIRGFPLQELQLSGRGQTPFAFAAGPNSMGEDFCRGMLDVDGHAISWQLRYTSTFRVTLSSKGWIGFSRSPHSDAVFSGNVILDGRSMSGDPLGFGVQGHNCGYRHRGFWRWAHAYFPRGTAPPTSLEALVYDMPFGLVFRRAVLWHDRQQHVLRSLIEEGKSAPSLKWAFRGSSRHGVQVRANFEGPDSSVHRLPYVKTDCSGTFPVVNNSLARVSLQVQCGDNVEQLTSDTGAVLEMGGFQPDQRD